MQPRLQKAAGAVDSRPVEPAHRPGRGSGLDRPAHGLDQGDDSRDPGGRQNQFNLASQARRQAGSTFKTFVLATAIQQGIDPSSTYYLSAPFHYQPDPLSPAWDVSTYDHSYSARHVDRERDAEVRQHRLRPADAGRRPGERRATAHALGIRTPLPPYPSMGLGSIAVSPLEMASAYATLAAGGVYSEPTGIRKVLIPDGKRGHRTPAGASRRGSRYPGLGRGRGDADPRREHPERHRRRSQHRQACGRQDGDDDQPRGRLVRRLHALPLLGGLDGLPALGEADARRARDRGRRRHVPGADLARLHDEGLGRGTPATSASRGASPTGSRATAASTSTRAAATTRTARRARRTRGDDDRTTTRPPRRRNSSAPRRLRSAPRPGTRRR